MVEGCRPTLYSLFIPRGSLVVGRLRLLRRLAYCHLRMRRRHLPRRVLPIRRPVHRSCLYLTIHRGRLRHGRRW